MKFCSYLKVFILTVVLFSFSGVTAVEYFPSEPGPEFFYGNNPLIIHPTNPDGFLRVSCPDCNVMSYTSFIVDPAGNVFLRSLGSASTGGPDPDETYFEPHLKYLDFPLEQSKTWSSTATHFDLWGGEEDIVSLTATVQRTEIVSVPAGEFEVIVVLLEFEYETQMWMNRSEVLWLHVQLGPVKNLVSWTGVVASEETPWGTVKALYR